MTSQYIVIESASAISAETLLLLKNFDHGHFPTPWNSESWDQLFEGHDRLLILSQNQDQLLGFILFDINIVDSFAHLLKVVTHPMERGKGFGNGLLEQALNVLKKHSIQSYFLEVEENNHSAVKLYVAHGFKIIHKKKHFYSNGTSALIMTKVMTKSSLQV